MKINKILPFSLFAGGILLASLSCTREKLDIPTREESPRVPVTLALSVEGMDSGTPETKAVTDPDIPEYQDIQSQIKNFVVLQFDGSGESAKLAAAPTFVDSDNIENYFSTETVDLLPATRDNQQFTFVVVANYTNSSDFPSSNVTLGEFMKRFQELKSYDSVFLKDGDKNYLRMSGSAVTIVPRDLDDGFNITVDLIRNVSKITINVKDETAGEVILEKVQLRDINAKYYYLTPLDADKEPAYEDSYSAITPCRIDKEAEYFPTPDGNGIRTLTYYVPANLRGTTASENQFTKGREAPDGATRFCMYGTYGSEHTPVYYTYYLGGNLVNDFNLKPNHHYTYDITLKSKGDARTDYRIEDLAEVKFNVDANSYMVHPPLVEGQARTYAIPIRRAAVFWNAPGVNGGVYGAAGSDKYSSCKIDAATEWTAEVLWSDFNLNDPSDFLIKSSGKGYDPTDPEQDPYFRIKVKTGMKGNVVVAVKSGDTILWSWHFWITDYNPDREGLTPVNGTYIYDVEGGHVHRYNNDIFNTTEPTNTTIGYKYGFIMDRNLGASSDDYNGRKGTMFYQFGRKDPFICLNQSGSAQRVFMEGKSPAQSNPAIFRDETGETEGTGYDNIRYAVCHPATYIKGENNELMNPNNVWTDSGELCDKLSNWFDPKFYEHNGDQEILQMKKSIYDPCPPGWCLPTYSAFFKFSVTSDTLKDYLDIFGREYQLSDNSYVEYTGDGYNYFPAGRANKEKGVIYFPAHAYRASSGGIVADQFKNIAKLSSATPQAEQKAFHVEFTTKRVIRTTLLHTYAAPVRCIREYGVVVK